MRCGINAGLMLAHRLRRWASINPAYDQHLVFAGMLCGVVSYVQVKPTRL